MPNKKTRDTVPQFSYRHSLKKEEIKTYKRIALLLTGFFIMLLIIWFMGTNFINSLSFLANGTQEETSDNTEISVPLQTPTFSSLPEAVNTASIDISGETSTDVDVALFVNGKEISSKKSDSSGQFKFTSVKLVSGDNLLRAVATDSEGEKKEVTATVRLDTTKPGLAVSNPIDGASFPSNTKTVVVSGSTEPDAIVYVNDGQAVVDGSGKFSFNTTVTPGTNNLLITSTDSAGNITSVKINVTVEGASAPTEE